MIIIVNPHPDAGQGLKKNEILTETSCFASQACRMRTETSKILKQVASHRKRAG
ncbi:MAG: hypothetical protein IJ756_02400 [Paludibacteraceae bacterium]|nr:hypothetical protein [Paludibacteraceae bacterium]